MGLLNDLFGKGDDEQIQSPVNPMTADILGGQSLALPTQGHGLISRLFGDPNGDNTSPNRLINGGLRDLLGALADAHAESQGMTPRYAAKREAEQTASALDGFDTDPMGSIRRLSKVNPGLAQKYYTDMIAQKRADAQAERYAGLARNDQLANTVKARTLIGGILRSAKDPRAREAAMGTANKIAANAGIDLSDLPDVNDDTALNNWVYGTMNVKDQTSAEYRGDKLAEQGRHNRVTEATGEKNAETRRQGVKISGYLGAGRLYNQAGNLGERSESNDEKHRHNMASEGERTQHNRATEAAANARNTQATIANIYRNHEDALVDVHKSGKVRYTIDGGKNWIMAN